MKLKLTKLLSPSLISILLIIVLSVPALLALNKPGFFPTQDYIYVARLYQMDKAVKDGQFPVRWVSDFRFGEPLYNFYAPLPYYAGIPIKSLGFSYLNTIKILIALGIILSGVTMFFLGKKLFGVGGAVVASLLYIYAPYHSVDVYVRGALSESWALIFFPLIFLSSYLIYEKITVLKIIFLALSLAGLFYTHNIMTVLFGPFVVFWFGFLIWRSDSRLKLLKYLLAGVVLGVALGASFLFPAFFEKQYVQSEKLITGYFDFRGHFVAIRQWFINTWGYGASLWGEEDGMSFQLGQIHWVLLSLGILFSVVFRKTKIILLNLVFLLSFTLSLFMQHNRSAPIWESLADVLSYVQFPWRFLGISIFFASLIGGSVTSSLPRFSIFLAAVLAPAIIYFNAGFFVTDSYYLDSTDDHYISEKTLDIDDRLPKDYLPIWVKRIRDEKDKNPHLVFGNAEIGNYQRGSDWGVFTIKSQESVEVETPFTYFPGWEVLVNGKKVEPNTPDNYGLIKFNLGPGEYKVEMNFKDTLIRRISNLVSLLAIVFVIYSFIKPDKIRRRLGLT